MIQEKELQNIKQRFSIIGNNPTLNRAIEIAVQVANTDLSVLITGESGVGKENFPNNTSVQLRKHEKYIAVNCGAIRKALSIPNFSDTKRLFYRSFKRPKSYFEVADGGTIFLERSR